MQFMGRDRKMAWHSNQGAIGSPHELGAKSGSKLAALQTLARQGCVPKYREAFGVRPACRRFCWFMVPVRGKMAVQATHEPCPLTSSLSPNGGEGARRAGEGAAQFMVPVHAKKRMGAL